MDITITTIGALIGLAVAIILIIKKIEPAYSMIAGAFVGGVIGGAGLEGTVSCMITGAQSIMPAILRIVTSGILAGVLIQSGAAVKIADQIIKIFGEKRALFSLALATMILTAVGVFGDVAVITVAPIAMVIGQRIGCSNFILLAALMMIPAFAMAEGVVKIGVFEPASGDSGAGGKQEMLGMQYANTVQPTVEIGGETYKVELV